MTKKRVVFMIINKLIENNLDIKFITRIEILVHEAGHNPAAAFSHSENYDYKQKGLQSYRKGCVYPTFKNTIGIINDDDNRKHMTIK